MKKVIWASWCKWFGHKWHEENFYRLPVISDEILTCSTISGHILILKCKRCSKEEILLGDRQIPISTVVEATKLKLNEKEKST